MTKIQEMIAPNKHPMVAAIQRASQDKKYRRADTAPRDLGAKSLGSGVYGTAYDRGDHVVKVYHDPAYHAFVKYAKANQDDPHMPRIHSSGTIKGTPYHYVKMEKLHGTKHLTGGAEHIEDMHSISGGDPEEMHTLLHHDPIGKKLKKKNPTLHASVDKLLNHFKYGSFDLHSDNMMYRPKTGHVVITDPITEHGGSTLKEMISPNKHPMVQKLQADPEATYGNHKKLDHSNILGSGLSGAAYDRGSKGVVKVYRDKSYHKFLDYVKKNQDDPHLPKIYASGKIKGAPYAAVRMEKLSNIDEKHPLHKHITMRSPDRGKEAPPGTLYRLNRLGDYDPVNNPAHKAFHQEFPSLSKSISKLADHFPSEFPDFHAGNFMKRKDGTPVIIDPLYDSSDGRIKKSDIKEEAPTNSAGGGHIAGIGIGPQGEPGRPGPMLRRSKFAGQEVFEVTSELFHKARMSKQKHLHWKSYIGEDDTGAAIREFANKNPKKAIILKDERTGAMHYARLGFR